MGGISFGFGLPPKRKPPQKTPPPSPPSAGGVVSIRKHTDTCTDGTGDVVYEVKYPDGQRLITNYLTPDLEP